MFSTNLEAWFSNAGLIAMIGWMILIFGPRRWPLLSAFPAYVIPAILSLGYAILILRHFGKLFRPQTVFPVNHRDPR